DESREQYRGPPGPEPRAVGIRRLPRSRGRRARALCEFPTPSRPYTHELRCSGARLGTRPRVYWCDTTGSGVTRTGDPWESGQCVIGRADPGATPALTR